MTVKKAIETLNHIVSYLKTCDPKSECIAYAKFPPGKADWEWCELEEFNHSGARPSQIDPKIVVIHFSKI